MTDPSSALFFEAIQKGDRKTVEAWLDRDAVLAAARSESGVSAVLTALYYQEPAIAGLLIERGAPLDLFEASAAGQTRQVEALLQADPAQVNAFAPDGFQPLGLAAFFGHAGTARVLLEHGADANTPSRNGLKVQPLNSAVAGQHLEIARLLLEHGADANALQAEGFTPLHGAAQNGQVEMIELLLAYGANPQAATPQGKTPYGLALEAGHLEAAERLQSGAPIP